MTDHPVTLLLAFELGERTWKLGFTIEIGQRPRVRQIPAGAVERVRDEVRRAKRRLGVAADAPVVSCYEAGRDGFWLHRYLVAHEVTNYVVPEWPDVARPGDHPRREQARALADGSAGVELGALSAAECVGAVVSAPLWRRRPPAAPDWHCGAGPQAVDRALALGERWRHPGGGGGDGGSLNTRDACVRRRP